MEFEEYKTRKEENCGFYAQVGKGGEEKGGGGGCIYIEIIYS